MKRALTTILAFACVAFFAADVQAQKLEQTEEEFQQLMPISGKVETYFGDFKLDHSFPAVGEAQRIYDLMDRQRAAQLYLWGVPLVGMTRWHEAYKHNYKDYDYNTLVSAHRFNERRGSDRSVPGLNAEVEITAAANQAKRSGLVLDLTPLRLARFSI